MKHPLVIIYNKSAHTFVLPRGRAGSGCSDVTGEVSNSLHSVLIVF